MSDLISDWGKHIEKLGLKEGFRFSGRSETETDSLDEAKVKMKKGFGIITVKRIKFYGSNGRKTQAAILAGMWSGYLMLSRDNYRHLLPGSTFTKIARDFLDIGVPVGIECRDDGCYLVIMHPETALYSRY